MKNDIRTMQLHQLPLLQLSLDQEMVVIFYGKIPLTNGGTSLLM